MNASTRRDLWSLIAVASFAACARLALVPFATTDGGDAPSRVWAAWDWLSRPSVLTHGVWGPLHTYLIGAVLWAAPDPVHAPVALSVLLSVLSVGAMYWFVRSEFADWRGALVVGLAYAVYPIAIRNGVSVRSETPFVLFLLLSMVALARLRAGGSTVLAAAAGLSLTLASMLRYESWVLIPIFAWLVPRSRRLRMLFLLCALLHPVFWMIGNWVHNGDPLYGFTAAAHWELESMGRAQADSRLLLVSALSYPIAVVKGMTWPIGLLCGAGAVLAVTGRHRSSVWLVPLVAVLVLWCLGIARGALVPKVNYIEIAGTLLFPFLAVTCQRLESERWSAGRLAAIALAVPAVSLLFTCRPCLRRLHLGKLASFSPVPRIDNQSVALALADTLHKELGADESLVSDHYGWGVTQYVALLTRLPRRQIYLAPGAPNQSIGADALAVFLTHHPRGLLLAASGSRFARFLDLEPGSSRAAVNGTSVRLELLRTVSWPGRSPTTLTIYRYSVSGAADRPRQ